MKTIKIFLASSEELKDERLEMTDLVGRLNQTFKGRGIQLELKRWEYLDSSMGDQRKQDEYNDVLRECDICLVLFWRRFGSYTGEELDVAYQCYKDKHKPEKIYVFFENPDDEDVTTELKEFIKSYESRYGGHFFNKFLTIDSLKLEFLLQFELYQKDQLGEKTIEVRNEHVYVDNEMVADLNNIPFAANNEGFKKRQAELKILDEEIEKKRKELDEKNAALQLAKEQQTKLGIDSLQMLVDMAQKAVNETEDGLQELLDKKNKLKKEFEREQQNLFNTARRITEQRGQKISERMARAIEAFESGDAQRADIILDEAEKDFEEARKDFRITKKVSVQALEEQIQRASYKMSNDSIPIEERVSKTLEIYEEANAFAQEINYDQEKYIDFLWDYSAFLERYANYDKALKVCNRLVKLCEDFFGKEHPATTGSYNNIGVIYNKRGDYDKSLEYHQKALEIREKVLGKEHPDTASSYNNIGLVYSDLDDYDKAQEYHQKALDIYEKVLGKEHPDTASSYNNIGNVYSYSNEYDKALEYYKQALDIWEKDLDKEHPDTASSYNNIGNVYKNRGDYDKALEYYKQALDIQEEVLGKEHPDTASSYNNIGNVYIYRRDFDKALEYYKRALDIQEKALGKEHPDTAGTYYNIGIVYFGRGDYDKALEYHKLALDIQEKALGKEHPDTAASYNIIGLVYSDRGDYDKALVYFNLAAKLENAGAQYNLGRMYYNGQGIEKDYVKAAEWYQKVAEKGDEEVYSQVACAYLLAGKYAEAIPWAENAVEAFPQDPRNIDIYATVYQGLELYDDALELFEICLKLQREQGATEERIQKTEAKIATLKSLMQSDK